MSDELVATHRSQIVRMRRLAAKAITAYDVCDPRLELIAHGENTTFRVIARDSNLETVPTAGEMDGHYLLRVHRPTRHGRNVDSEMAIASELQWLMALRADTSRRVTAPVAGGASSTELHLSDGAR